MYSRKRDIVSGTSRTSKASKLQANDKHGDIGLHGEEQTGVNGCKTYEEVPSTTTSERDAMSLNNHETTEVRLTWERRHDNRLIS